MVPMQTRRMEKLFKNCSATGLYLNLMNGLKSFDEKLCKNNDFYFSKGGQIKVYFSLWKCLNIFRV